MSLDVRGKVVVITGASRGLGRGMADAMRERGVRLGLCARGQVTERSHDVFARSVDVTDGEAVMAFAGEVVDALGPIDLWINNAGVLEPIAFVRDVSSEDFQQHLAINVLGVLHGAQAYLAQLSRRPPGHKGVILNISSGAALKGYAAWGAYCAGKAAVDRLTECLQLEESARLRAHAVAPGVIDTDMQQLIRSLTPEQFPMVEKFIELAERNAFNSPAYVADRLLAIAFDERFRPTSVVTRLPSEVG